MAKLNYEKARRRSKGAGPRVEPERRYVDAAREDGQHTVIERYGRPAAVLVPVTWYISKGGDPREPLPDLTAEG